MDNKTSAYHTIEKHIGVLDGVRAIAISLVVWFHFWQQSWLTPPGILANMVRYGSVFVDMLILLSAVCNFYPYAQAILLKEEWPDIKQFYYKRMIRILPSYLLCIAIMFIVALVRGRYLDTSFLWKDLLTHLTFTSTFSAEISIGSQLNGVLWTVQIEVLYYLIMPFLAKAFRRVPILTTLSLWAIAIGSQQYILHYRAGDIRFLLNHMFTFAGYYANGMLICLVYLSLHRYAGGPKRDAANRCLQLTASLFCIYFFFRLMDYLGTLGDGELQINQLRTRTELNFLFSGILLGLLFTFPLLKKIFDNVITRFVCAISYNLYIWHQVIAVWLKELHIPYWSGDTPPNMLNDRAWMWHYQLLILLDAVVAAAILTYCFERPAAAWLKKKLHL